MDTIGKLVLDDDGIETVHKNYIVALKKYEDSKKSANSGYYIASIRSLVMRHQKFCDYCDNDTKKIRKYIWYTIMFKCRCSNM